ncbi:hypothetical protein B0H66DRAFT_17848 [Apodospora peruviana]|uniref:Uncharacterized protein n=1 Tax=Apodospora peruviana TaxID=516989 RepID=A0AAE0MEI3_9PEZI|nr:hypothetical protein B0H66DRAFT_17848 [Apodospora peruviana]
MPLLRAANSCFWSAMFAKDTNALVARGGGTGILPLDPVSSVGCVLQTDRRYRKQRRVHCRVQGPQARRSCVHLICTVDWSPFKQVTDCTLFSDGKAVPVAHRSN